MTWRATSAAHRRAVGERGARLLDRLRRPLAVAIALELLVLGLVFGLRVRAIATTMPYPNHVDEPLLTEPAGRILTDGDWNPHFFMYPSLPIYVTAGAFAAGYLSAASHGEVHSTKDIGRVGYPFYRQARVMWPAKILFVLFSLVAAAGAAWVAYRLAGEPALLPLVPAVLALSDSHDKLSWTYLNVNVMGDALVWSTLAFLLVRLGDSSFRAKAVIPGLLVGATAATKYNFASLALPALLAIAWRGGERKADKSLLLGALAAVTFLVTVPYSVLDTPAFLTDLGKIMGIYQEGFLNHESAPGLPHLLLNLRLLVTDLGWLTLPFALAGLWHLLRRAPGATALVLSFPLVLLLHMSLQKAHFLRNLLSLFPLYALLVATGIVVAYRALAAWLVGRTLRGRPVPPGGPRFIPALVVTAAALVVLPFERPRADWYRPVDSRTAAIEWLQRHLPPHTTVIVPEELSIDLRSVAEAGHGIRRIPFRGETPSSLLARLAAAGEDAVVLYPLFGSDHWDVALAKANLAEAEELNRLRGKLTPLAEFGWGAVSVSFDYVVAGNPRFLIGRLELPAAERAGLGQPRAVPLESFGGLGGAFQGGELSIFGAEPSRSAPLELAAGRWRLAVLARGTAARGKMARLRFKLGDRVIGAIVTRPSLREEILEFDLPGYTMAPLEISITNDRVESGPDGETLDRNAYLRSIQLFSLGSLGPSSPSSDDGR